MMPTIADHSSLGSLRQIEPPAARSKREMLHSIVISRIPAKYPFVRQMATQLRDHDGRAQFLAGIDLILAGIGTIERKP
jgi:hypothetical protein